MSEEQTNPTPRQMEYTITLPDRGAQWEKCPAIVNKTKTVQLVTRETIDGNTVETEGEEQEVEYQETLMDTSDPSNPIPVMLSDCVNIVHNAVTMLSAPSKMTTLQSDLSPAEVAVPTMADSITGTFADEDGVVDEDVLKQRAKWGLGCPGSCGHFWEFPYQDMVPQILICPKCGVKVTLT